LKTKRLYYGYKSSVL